MTPMPSGTSRSWATSLRRLRSWMLVILRLMPPPRAFGAGLVLALIVAVVLARLAGGRRRGLGLRRIVSAALLGWRRGDVVPVRLFGRGCGVLRSAGFDRFEIGTGVRRSLPRCRFESGKFGLVLG